MEMSTFEAVLLMLLVLDALALGALVLLQQGKGADAGAAFGAGAANTMFGSSGSSSFLVRATVALAIGFFVISAGRRFLASRLLQQVAALRSQRVLPRRLVFRLPQALRKLADLAPRLD